MITAYLPKLHASRRFDMRISNCSEYMKSRQNHATCRLWKTLEPQICLRCLWKCFQRVQRPQIDLQLTWSGLQNIHFGDTNDFPIFSVFLAFCLCLSPSPFWPGSYELIVRCEGCKVFYQSETSESHAATDVENPGRIHQSLFTKCNVYER